MSSVQIDNLSSPGKLVGYPLPLRLADAPKFQILNTIVRTIPVKVVNLFMIQEAAAQRLLHDYAVLPLARRESSSPDIGAVYVSALIDAPIANSGPSASRTPGHFGTASLPLVVHVTKARSQEWASAIFVCAVHVDHSITRNREW